jgi:hypothetical protein
MLGHLEDRLPAAPPPPVPAPAVGVVEMTERAVGLGNRRGNDGRGPFPMIALKGGRLDAIVRFQLWAANPPGVDAAVLALQQALLADRGALTAAGFLRLDGSGTTPAEPFADPAAWRGTADYRLLYEYRYAETEGAESLIARIPIAVDGETTVVTDWMARWDTHGAPDLEVRRGGRRSLAIRGLYVVSFLPAGWDGERVTVESLSGGLLRRRNFPDVRALVAELTADGDDVELGTKTYATGRLDFAEPVTLARAGDFFRVRYDGERLTDAGADTEAVLYLRAFA